MKNSERGKKNMLGTIQEKEQLILNIIDQENNMAEWIAENRFGKNGNYTEKRKDNLHSFYWKVVSPYLTPSTTHFYLLKNQQS